MNKKTPIPTGYWSYRFRRLNGKKRYVKIKKINGKIKIRVASRRK